MLWTFDNVFNFWRCFRFLATLWTFGNALDVWQRFGRLAMLSTFGNVLDFDQSFGLWLIDWTLINAFKLWCMLYNFINPPDFKRFVGMVVWLRSLLD